MRAVFNSDRAPDFESLLKEDVAQVEEMIRDEGGLLRCQDALDKLPHLDGELKRRKRKPLQRG